MHFRSHQITCVEGIYIVEEEIVKGKKKTIDLIRTVLNIEEIKRKFIDG